MKKTHKKSEFDCGKKLLNDYLAKLVKQDVEKNVAICYILEREEEKVIGYFTLSSGSIKKMIFLKKKPKDCPDIHICPLL